MDNPSDKMLSGKINKLKKDCKDAPEQKSPEWYKIRFSSIGGSEIASIKGRHLSNCQSYKT